MFQFRYYFILSFLFFIELLYAQFYTPIDTSNFEQRKIISEKYLKKQKVFFKTLSSDFKRGELRYAKRLFKETKKEFNNEILKGHYIFDDSINMLINQTVDLLKARNSQIEKNTDIFVSRNISLNAFSMPDESFVINLGSFYFLENELQLSALISHEFAHSILKHSVASIKKEYKMMTDESRKNLKEIKRSKYGRGEKALERYKKMIYFNGKMNRSHEYEADSLGYVLYRNADLKPSEYMNAFRLMFEYDTIRPLSLDVSIYRKIFDLPEQKFKDDWLKMEDFTDYDYSKFTEKINSDSIKSHPEMNDRIARLEMLFPELKANIQTDTANTLYSKIQKLAKFERFTTLDLNEDYGLGVFLCLVKLSTENNLHKDFYKYWLGKYFSKILKARKEYKLNRYLDRVDPKNQSLDYQQFLNFMWNLKISEIEIISTHYTK